MPIDKEEFEKIDERHHLKGKVLTFLNENRSKAYHIREICKELNINVNTMQWILGILKKEEKVKHKKPYWIFSEWTKVPVTEEIDNFTPMDWSESDWSKEESPTGIGIGETNIPLTKNLYKNFPECLKCNHGITKARNMLFHVNQINTKLITRKCPHAGCDCQTPISKEDYEL